MMSLEDAVAHIRSRIILYEELSAKMDGLAEKEPDGSRERLLYSTWGGQYANTAEELQMIATHIDERRIVRAA